MPRFRLMIAFSCAAAMLLLPSNASAAQVVGSSLTATPDSAPAENSISLLSVQATGNPLPVVPSSPGVIVSIRLKHGTSGANPGAYGFRILSGVLPLLTARVPVEQPDVVWDANDAPGLRTFVPTTGGAPGGTPKGIPINAGEYLAFQRTGGTGGQGLQMRAPAPGAERRIRTSVHNSGEADYSAIGMGVENLIQYTVEPDADRDGYGDETQDKCATSAATQAACPKKAKKCKKKKTKQKPVRPGRPERPRAEEAKKKSCKKKKKK